MRKVESLLYAISNIRVIVNRHNSLTYISYTVLEFFIKSIMFLEGYNFIY